MDANKAAAETLSTSRTSHTVRITWGQFVVTTRVGGQTSRVAIAAETQEDAVTYARNARAVMETVHGFESMGLSRESGSCVAHFDLAFDAADGCEDWELTIESGDDWRKATPGRNIAGEVWAATSALR